MRLKPNDRTHRLNAIVGTQDHEEKTIMKTKAFLFTGILFTVCLIVGVAARPATTKDADWPRWRGPFETGMALGDAPTTWSDSKNIKWKVPIPGRRSEEHTSELQSQSNLVCRLLLEKKKKK